MERLVSSGASFALTAFATAIFAVAGCCSLAGQPAQADEISSVQAVQQSVSQVACQPISSGKNLPRVSATVLINAPPDEVFRTIHEERMKDPDLAYSRVIEQISPTECKLEQKFSFLPVIGTSVCLMSNSEVLNERIDYWLVHSDHFKAMEGSWILTPCDEGRSTKLELSSHLDLGLPVPRSFMNSITSKKIHKRLANVKALAEAHAMRMAAAKKLPAQ